MGTTVVAGRSVTIREFDDNGQPAGTPIITPFVALRGNARAEVLQRGAAVGAPETMDEKNVPGSEDWLTVIAIADSQAKLDALVAGTTTPFDGDAHTSASSRRVRVEFHIGDDRRTLKDTVTISHGEVVSLPPKPILNVETIKVISCDTALTRNPSLRAEFAGIASQFVVPQPK